MERTRRALLTGAGTAVAAGLAGCSGSDDEPEGSGADTESEPEATEASTPTPEPTPEIQVIVDETVNIPEDDYESWQFYVDGEFELNYEFTVTEGSTIDVYVMEHRELARYQSEQGFEAAVASEDIQSDSASVELSEATYHLVVDHTSRGRAEPPGGIGKDPVTIDMVANYQKL